MLCAKEAFGDSDGAGGGRRRRRPAAGGSTRSHGAASARGDEPVRAALRELGSVPWPAEPLPFADLAGDDRRGTRTSPGEISRGKARRENGGRHHLHIHQGGPG